MSKNNKGEKVKRKRPIIGIVSRINSDSSGDSVNCIMDDYRIAIIKSGGVPILILPPQSLKYNHYKPREIERLNDKEKELLEDSINLCDGILFPGGTKWYEFDEYIYYYAYEKDIPILGICAGMQMMACLDNNRYKNCFDTTKLNETGIEHYNKTAEYVHDVSVVVGSKLSEIVGQTKISVNSRHHYHVDKVTSFKINAYSKDGLIEGIEDPTKRFLLGLQWHPESMIQYDQNANKILLYFVQKCSENMI